MKLFTLKILSIFFSLLLISCENVDVVETRLEFKEKIVVSAELPGGSIFTGVTFTKTLPVDEEYHISKAEIKNAVSYLKIDGVKVIPLHYEKDGLYKPRYNLLIERGKTFELFGNVNGKSVYSKTIIPQEPSVNNTIRESDHIQASVLPKLGEAYGVLWLINSPSTNFQIDASRSFQTITAASEDSAPGSILVRTSVIPGSYLSPPYTNYTYVEVCAFDMAYMKYHNSRNNQQVEDNTYLQGGESAAWNVYGEDVIGLFIGKTKGSKIKVN